ncbi:GPW/gp25 family protein [Pelosinus sp. IPA-1]|uniref:GPW/gp25 family protein n=1 Tax=Pelosinus sp. IPA-1 TaxID=3029569 RepID=UPI0025541E5F|nr:GPW/gp25 family protein [Pelosinus sp. IPA-1]
MIVIKNKALGIDIALESNSNLLAATGDIRTTDTNDLAVIDDLEVVRQALVKRLNTRKGELWAHPEYGCDIWDILSELMTDTWYKQAVSTIRDCINDDPRSQVISVTYDSVPQDRQVTFTILYSVIDGRKDNLVWDYAPEAVTDSV